MGKEYITIQVGQCGNRIGKQFWSQLSKEHGIDTNTGNPLNILDNNVPHNPSTFFDITDNHYTARSILLDTEPTAVQENQLNLPGIFRDRNCWVCRGNTGAGNTWSKGFDNGIVNQDLFLDMIKRELDLTDNFEGFQILHSVTGGTGSGLGSALLEILKEHYPKKNIITYSVFPDEGSSNLVEPYNTILTLKRLSEFSDSTVMFDNKALSNIANKIFKDNQQNGFTQENQIINSVISSVSNQIRFPNYIYNSLSSVFQSVIPTPELNFLVPSFTPFTSDYITGGKPIKPTNAYDIMLDLIEPSYSLVSFPDLTRIPTYLGATATIITNNIIQKDINRGILRSSQKLNFAKWVKPSIQMSIGRTSPFLFNDTHNNNNTGLTLHQSNSNHINGMLLSNTSAVVPIFKNIVNSFDSLFDKKAFLQQFKEGSLFTDDLSEFEDSKNAAVTLINSYLEATSPSYLDDILHDVLRQTGYDENNTETGNMNILDDNNNEDIEMSDTNLVV